MKAILLLPLHKNPLSVETEVLLEIVADGLDPQSRKREASKARFKVALAVDASFFRSDNCQAFSWQLNFSFLYTGWCSGS
jgi:hypothetical protein